MISVITPVYNGERFIEACIRSVIGQDCSDIEHIIVDGCSQDRTTETIEHYAEKHPHILWISEKDEGQSDALNKGINMAQGDIIAILNVDDYYEPGVLNKVSNIFKSLEEPGLLVGNCNVWDFNGNFITLNKPEKLKLNQLLLGWNVNPLPCNPSAYFYHTSLHKITGLYDVQDSYTMDLDFIFKAIQIANIKYVNETFGNFVQTEGSKTFSGNKDGLSEQRIETIIKRYRKNLPVIEQLISAFLYQFYKHKINYSNPKSTVKQRSPASPRSRGSGAAGFHGSNRIAILDR
ncbi:MAG: glycosyltransferase [Leptolyngbyaceae cyanobacterium SL_7_1]|nr:glycosyltransferase [Leptolyngbyaceae cyanobacterium SL_7_1]